MIVVSVAVWTAVGAFLGFVSEAGGALAEWISGAATAAYDFVAGLVDGIANGAGAVIGAVKGLGEAALGAMAGIFDSHSPSKVMLSMGQHDIAGALGTGIEAGTDDVHGAASGMAGAAVKGASSGGDAGGGGGAGKSTNIVVNVQIDGAGHSAQEITEIMVSQTFQRIALESGL